MKKLIALLLAAALVLPCALTAFAADDSGSFGAYAHVFIIGVDGAGRFIKDADTPNFDRIFADGAVDYAVRVEVKTDSGPNWGSMLTGVSYFQHKIQNGNSGEEQRTSDTEYPSIFTCVRRAMPEAALASFVHWNNINYGIIETDIGVEKVQVGSDAALTDEICAYFDAGNAPTLFFVQLDEVDAAGHSFGSNSEEYFAALHTADGYVGQIYDALERNGLLEDSLFIVTADHGHRATGGHGGITMRESLTTIAAAGRTVEKGGALDKITRDRDIAAIALYALGIERPAAMTARLPAHLFAGVDGESRPFFKDIVDGILSPVVWVFTLMTAIF